MFLFKKYSATSLDFGADQWRSGVGQNEDKKDESLRKIFKNDGNLRKNE